MYVYVSVFTQGYAAPSTDPVQFQDRPVQEN